MDEGDRTVTADHKHWIVYDSPDHAKDGKVYGKCKVRGCKETRVAPAYLTDSYDSVARAYGRKLGQEKSGAEVLTWE